MGFHDGLVCNVCPTHVHGIFLAHQPHGDTFAVVSPCINAAFRTTFDVLPHIVRVHPGGGGDLRAALGIPQGAMVFGRHGGNDTFDLAFAKDAVTDVARADPMRWFVFMNTEAFGPPMKNVVFLPGTWDMSEKRKFLDTCDAMLHAREDGETFGLACGEFAVLGKRVLTWGHGRDTFQLTALGDAALLYNDYEGLRDLLLRPREFFVATAAYGYVAYTPNQVMPLFDAFLRGAMIPAMRARYSRSGGRNGAHDIQRTGHEAPSQSASSNTASSRSPTSDRMSSN